MQSSGQRTRNQLGLIVATLELAIRVQGALHRLVCGSPSEALRRKILQGQGREPGEPINRGAQDHESSRNRC
jgi:hypothetical protein